MNKTWYFTFGIGMVLAGRVQPISAPSYELARTTMFEVYGGKWAFQYSEEEWLKIKNKPDKWWSLETELPLINVKEAANND